MAPETRIDEEKSVYADQGLECRQWSGGEHDGGLIGSCQSGHWVGDVEDADCGVPKREAVIMKVQLVLWGREQREGGGDD